MTNDTPNTPAKMKAGEAVASDFSDDDLWRFWWDRPAVEDGEPDDMEAEFVAAARRIIATERTRAETAREIAWLAQQQAEPGLAPQATSAQMIAAHVYLRGCEIDMAGVELDNLLAIFGIGSDTKAAAMGTQATQQEGAQEFNAAMAVAVLKQPTPQAVEPARRWEDSPYYEGRPLCFAPKAAAVVSEDARMLDWLEKRAHWENERDMGPGGRWWAAVLVASGQPAFREAIRAAMSADGAIAAPGVGEQSHG